MTHRRSGRIGEIEVLRGVAILMVLTEHLAFNLFSLQGELNWALLHGWRGAAGVDLFFVISGFVIARTLLPDLTAAIAAGRVRAALARFWVRRAFRLLPAAWCWIAVPLALTLLFNRSGSFHDWGTNVHPAQAALLNVANIYAGLTLKYRDGGMTLHYWSLSLEEQFYLLLPLLFLLLLRRLVWLLVALVLWQFFVNHGYLLLLTRPGGLAVGVLVAIWHQSGRALPSPALLARYRLARFGFFAGGIALCGLLISDLPLLWLGGWHADEAAPTPLVDFGWGGLPLLCGALVHVAALNRGLLIAAGGTRRALEWIGTRSYSLYLTHRTGYALTREVWFRLTGANFLETPLAQPVLVLSAAVIVLGLAEFSYRAIEVPFRRRGARIAAGWGGKEDVPF